jgi:hypothetical protein
VIGKPTNIQKKIHRDLPDYFFDFLFTRHGAIAGSEAPLLRFFCLKTGFDTATAFIVDLILATLRATARKRSGHV